MTRQAGRPYGVGAWQGLTPGGGGGALALSRPFSDAEELELTLELLTLSHQGELDHFLGKLLKKAWGGIKKFGAKVLKPLGSVLKAVAKKALPFLGGALGSLIPIPGVGTALGSALGGAVSKALELEREGLDTEDREFELARRFVHLAGSAAQHAAQVPPSSEPLSAARAAVEQAARRMNGGAGNASAGGARSGRWVREGNTLVLLGV